MLALLIATLFVPFQANELDSFEVIILKNSVFATDYKDVQMLFELNWVDNIYQCNRSHIANTNIVCNVTDTSTRICDKVDRSENMTYSITIHINNTNLLEAMIYIDKFVFNFMDNTFYTIDSFCIDDLYDYLGIDIINESNCSIEYDKEYEYIVMNGNTSSSITVYFFYDPDLSLYSIDEPGFVTINELLPNKNCIIPTESIPNYTEENSWWIWMLLSIICILPICGAIFRCLHFDSSTTEDSMELSYSSDSDDSELNEFCCNKINFECLKCCNKSQLRQCCKCCNKFNQIRDSINVFIEERYNTKIEMTPNVEPYISTDSEENQENPVILTQITPCSAYTPNMLVATVPNQIIVNINDEYEEDQHPNDEWMGVSSPITPTTVTTPTNGFTPRSPQSLYTLASMTGGTMKQQSCNKAHSNRFEEAVETLLKIQNDYGKSVEYIDGEKCLNDFLYLMTYHNNDNDYELIHKLLEGFCDITTCNIFKRNYRNRTKYNDNEQESKYDTPEYEILDKIHCFYAHGFDIGYRLNSAERAIINENDTKEDDLEDELFDAYIINRKVMKTNELLSNKYNIYKNIDGIDSRLIRKYNQLNINDIKNNKDDSGDAKMYSFGSAFFYGELDPTNDGNDDIIIISKKYASLKKELTDNKLCRISIKQYDNQWKKACIHHNCMYRKENYDFMNVDDILSIMIYCNFTELQYEFSKTYRESIHEHTNFYHLGKCLKVTVKKFGTKIENGKIKSFYHGIGEKLLFPSIIVNVRIYSPLSTSSSLEVATTFANCNNGLIVEFGSNYNGQSQYFSVSWLSDFGNEQEQLFIQNDWWLRMNNIIDTKLGYEFDGVLTGLKIIDDITRGIGIITIPKSIMCLINNIIKNQLNNKAWNELPEYAQNLINIYFANKKIIRINYLQKRSYLFLEKLLFYQEFEWININSINILFPNLELLVIENIKLYYKIFQDLLNYFNQIDCSCKLRKIVIRTADIGGNSECVISKYKHKFNHINVDITAGHNDNSIHIERMNAIN